MYSNSVSRQSIRSYHRAKRRKLSSQQQLLASAQILQTCLTHSVLPQVKTVACYLANDGEIAPAKIVEYCWESNKKVLLPVIHPFCKKHLIFVEYLPDTPMRKNTYGIPEPILACQKICPLADIDMIMTPLVAFDSQGNRLGMGGGYYDRTLAPAMGSSPMPQLIGLAHDCQKATRLPKDSWDIPMQGIATPSEFFVTR